MFLTLLFYFDLVPYPYLDIHEQVRSKNRNKAQWAEIESRYVKQRTWRKVANAAARGMRDHTADFNKAAVEKIPSSWVLKVGRTGVVLVEGWGDVWD